MFLRMFKDKEYVTFERNNIFFIDDNKIEDVTYALGALSFMYKNFPNKRIISHIKINILVEKVSKFFSKEGIKYIEGNKIEIQKVMKYISKRSEKEDW